MRWSVVLGLVAGLAASGSAQPTWRLVEDLRIGGDADGPKNFVEVRGIAVTKAGNIFVLDTRAKELRVFDASGTFLKVAGRDGAGPGEIRNALGVTVGANDVIWVKDRSNARYNLYRPDGTFLKQLPATTSPYGYFWNASVDASGRLIDPWLSIVDTSVKSGDNRKMYVRRVSESGRIDTLAPATCPSRLPVPPSLTFAFSNGSTTMAMRIPFLSVEQAVYTRAGTAWCTPSNEYLLLAGDLGAPLNPVVDRKTPAVEVTAQERDRELRMVDSLTRNVGRMVRGDVSMIPKRHPVIINLLADDDARAWVRLKSAGPNSLAFDVFDRSGRHIARTSGTGTIGNFSHVTATHLYTVATDDDDIPYIVRYRIQR
jgi:hypothetical protein